MIINYKRLNDNTLRNIYKLPNKDELVNCIQKATWFSKFDCKSGFWQIKLDEESIPWTAFSCSEGHFEWLVMPFGLKNAPQVFQARMDRIFKKISNFCIVYIDDILVFSNNRYVHTSHVHKILDLCKENNIILSKKKIELFKNKIDFLGLKIDKGKIELQPHITTKILSFPNKLEETKELQKILGLLNYGRKFIPNLSTLVTPLYNKLSKNGQRYFNNEDVKLIQRIKEIVKNLGPIALPIDSYYKIIQTDASSKGWAGILIQKPTKGSPKDLEEIAMYSSGKFSEPESRKSSTELELLGIINTLNNFHIYIYTE